ncbi:hypothetical protein [Nocardia sp. NPDC004711]
MGAHSWSAALPLGKRRSCDWSTTLDEIRALRASGALPKPLREESRLRWWMLPLGFAGLFFSAILISHLASWLL